MFCFILYSLTIDYIRHVWQIYSMCQKIETLYQIKIFHIFSSVSKIKCIILYSNPCITSVVMLATLETLIFYLYIVQVLLKISSVPTASAVPNSFLIWISEMALYSQQTKWIVFRTTEGYLLSVLAPPQFILLPSSVININKYQMYLLNTNSILRNVIQYFTLWSYFVQFIVFVGKCDNYYLIFFIIELQTLGHICFKRNNWIEMSICLTFSDKWQLTY